LNTVPCSKEIRELATTWLNLSQEKCGEDIMNRTTFEDPTVYRNERKDFKNYPRKAAAPRAEPVNVDDDEIGVSVRTV